MEVAALPDRQFAARGPAGGGFDVQIGAYVSPDEAQRRIEQVRGRTGNLLSGYAGATIPVQTAERQMFRARFVNFDERGNPAGKPVPVLTGFLNQDGTTKGRPTWVTWDKTGALLVSDDTGNTIWRVAAPGAEPNPAPQRIRGESLPPLRELRGDPNQAAEVLRESR